MYNLIFNVWFLELPGKPMIMEPSLASITENSVTVTCYVLDVGQPPLRVLRLAMLSPVERCKAAS